MVISIAGEPGDERVGQAVAEFGASKAIEKWQAGIGAKSMCTAVAKVINSPLLEQAVKSLNSVRGRFIIPSDEQWPSVLSDLDVATPVGLWCVGNSELDLETSRAIAIVGARSATSYGERIASDLGALAAEKSVTTISGAAFGIDAAAHRGSLAAGGTTVAVLACGVDVAYPQAHRGLLTRISEQGLVVSEAPPGSRPHKHRFLSRNRLIAALSSSTVVVEAALRSGSLSTSNWASALNRTVWGIPGPLTSAASAGVHAGIRDGVMRIVANPPEVFSEFPELQSQQLGLFEGAVLSEIAHGPLTTSQIASRLGGIEVHDLYGALTLMQLQGLIQQVANGWQAVK
jgi:DNA processing protein